MVFSAKAKHKHVDKVQYTLSVRLNHCPHALFVYFLIYCGEKAAAANAFHSFI